MCDTAQDGHRHATTVASVPTDLDAFEGERIPLAPVERVSITSLVDNVADLLAPDKGPAHRYPPWSWPTMATGLTEEHLASDGPQAEHGFSALVEIERTGGDVHRILFDAGVTPDGMVNNMR